MPQFQRPDFLTQQPTGEEVLAGKVSRSIDTLPSLWQKYKIEKARNDLEMQKLEDERNKRFYAVTYSPEGEASFIPYPEGGRPGPGAPAPTTIFSPEGKALSSVTGRTTMVKPPAGEGDLRKREEAKKRVSGQLQKLKKLYGGLSEAGAIVDVNKSFLENVKNRAAATRLGQEVGKYAGTKEQSLRNQIEQIKPLLLQEIRKATEMGARGLDSEKELEFYLKAATDPSIDLQTNMSALNVLDQAYGLGLGFSDLFSSGGTAGAPTPAAAPSPTRSAPASTPSPLMEKQDDPLGIR